MTVDDLRREIPAKTGFLIGVQMNSAMFQNDIFEHDNSVYMIKRLDVSDTVLGAKKCLNLIHDDVTLLLQNTEKS